MVIDAEYPKLLIVGLGNELLRDDGVGVHAVRELEKAPPENVVVAEVGTRVLAAQQLIEDADIVIAVDAAQAGGPPGSIYRFNTENIETGRPCSLHEMGIIGVLRLIPKESRPKVTVVGIETEMIDYGMELSPAVKAVLGRTVETVRRIVKEIRETGIAHLGVGSVCAQDNE